MQTQTSGVKKEGGDNCIRGANKDKNLIKLKYLVLEMGL